MAPCRICYCVALFFILNIYSINAWVALLPNNHKNTEYPSTILTNTLFSSQPISKSSSIYYHIRPVQPKSVGHLFACGLYCNNGNRASCLFAVYITQTDNNYGISVNATESTQVVWSANRDYPVGSDAILNFTATGNLVLQDVNGSTVWMTNTSGKSVASMKLTHTGNLKLVDVNESIVWQSFDHPTDCLVPGQELFQGQKLIPSVSSTDWKAQKGLFSLQVTNKGLDAYLGSNPRQVYYTTDRFKSYGDGERRRIQLLNGSLSFFPSDDANNKISIPLASSAQYMKFMPDGHLKVFEWRNGWQVVTEILYPDACDYPFACGRNAICSYIDQQCSCPMPDYFRALDDQPKHGCSEINPLTCNATQDHIFIPLKNVTLYTFSPADMNNASMEACKQACLKNCSCKAAVFEYYSNSSDGSCYLPSDLLSMIRFEEHALHINAITFMKVQKGKSMSHIPKKNHRPVLVVISSIIGSFLVVGFITSLIRKRRLHAQIEEEYMDVVPGLTIRFTYEELKTATENFSKKLGQGGFGSVFEGTLEDDAKIAVKCLDGLGQVKKSFLAEVESIGSIDHVNLVRLRGFSAWKSQWFLVYDFMSNGSLDKWIYHGFREQILGWECRKKIILDVAKGLAYLHEECTQKIIHLDIKPENILLDNDLNAKVSDFGLSKLINRDQSEVITTMRGTPGYMAPEWLSSVITEKVDVYSFGVVLLEILCGRRNLDRSQPVESWHLLGLFNKCWEQGMLLDIVDKYSEDMQTHSSEVMEMMKVASWCLQTDYTRRPSMSSVVKVLEGVTDVESNLDYNFTNPRLQNIVVEHEDDMTRSLVSSLYQQVLGE